MRWPWERNQHSWGFDQVDLPGVNLKCSRCGEIWHHHGQRFYSEPEDWPPQWGCTDMPIPCAAPATDAGGLPVVQCA